MGVSLNVFYNRLLMTINGMCASRDQVHDAPPAGFGQTLSTGLASCNLTHVIATILRMDI